MLFDFLRPSMASPYRRDIHMKASTWRKIEMHKFDGPIFISKFC